jgi:hypothetical protein
MLGGLAALTIALQAPAMVQAGESGLEDAPPPEAVEDVATPIERGFKKEERPSALFPRLKQALQDQPPFLSDTSLVLHLRSYWLEPDPPDAGEREAIAYGGWLAYQSGEWEDLFSIGATFYTTQRLYGPSEKDGTRLLAPGQHGFTVLGKAWARLRYEDHALTVYRQTLELPYVNRRDSRMIPNTFEGYTLRGSDPTLGYAVGYLSDIKERDSDRFVPMSEAAGVTREDEGMWMAGVRWHPTEETTIGAIDYWVDDTLNIFYAEFDYVFPERGLFGARLDAQFTVQRSVGKDLITGRSFDTRSFGLRTALSYEKAILNLAFTSTDDEERIRSPWGSDPSYLARMLKNYNRAGEDAWGVGISYHFARLGLPGVSTVVSFTHGQNARNASTGSSLPDRDEVNFTLDYRPSEGRLRGLWLRARAAFLEEDPGGTTSEFRLILNYDLSLL